jgi:hypothetical protein
MMAHVMLEVVSLVVLALLGLLLLPLLLRCCRRRRWCTGRCLPRVSGQHP